MTRISRRPCGSDASIESSKPTKKRLLVLDTDHFSDWERDSAAGKRFRVRLEAARPEMAVSIVTVEEQVRGWLAEIGRHRDPHRQIPQPRLAHRLAGPEGRLHRTCPRRHGPDSECEGLRPSARPANRELVGLRS